MASFVSLSVLHIIFSNSPIQSLFSTFPVCFPADWLMSDFVACVIIYGEIEHVCVSVDRCTYICKANNLAEKRVRLSMRSDLFD